ncbi:MAG TPA: ABC transporter substrate-binding protein [Gammaproteobacteria bacterium]|nr:ABC transporter substrate-binding protein [Gammaproteobacteria bacterium]
MLSAFLVAASRAQGASAVHPAATPEAAVEMLYAGLVDAASAHLGVQQRYERLEPVVEATHDMPYIAELTIRRQWSGLAPEERRRFVAAFERLSVMTYASRFGGLEKGMFKVTGSGAARDGRAQVQATLTTKKGKVIPFQYLLHQVEGGWKIVNILADNVSDLALKRAEYREVLEKGSIDDLIRHLVKQIDDAAAGKDVR